MNRTAAPAPKNDNSATPDTTVDVSSHVAPFFVLGCVRSGTTMLRDALRLHPNLACPEETHYFRWGEPYGTDGLNRTLSGNPVLKKHREMDGITEQEFAQMLRQSVSRAELYTRYMALYIKKRKPGAKRWFDKTPQNVYGALLAATSLPRAKFVHIVREPLNVVASLRIGRIVKVESLVGACSYWNEAVQIVSGLKRAYPARVYELRYEDFVAHPKEQMRLLLDFIGEPYDDAWFAPLSTREVDHRDEGVLSEEDQEFVRSRCAQGRRRYGYEVPATPESAPSQGVISNRVPGARKPARAPST